MALVPRKAVLIPRLWLRRGLPGKKQAWLGSIIDVTLWGRPWRYNRTHRCESTLNRQLRFCSLLIVPLRECACPYMAFLPFSLNNPGLLHPSRSKQCPAPSPGSSVVHLLHTLTKAFKTTQNPEPITMDTHH